MVSQSPKHVKWFVDIKSQLKTADGKDVMVWEFRHEKDDAVLSDWAKHFRNHYCCDREIDDLRRGTGHSRADYLNSTKFPDSKKALGPSTRSGDFSEILVADFLEYLLGYWVPRTRYDKKTVKNESTKGCDIIGFHIINPGKISSKDQLAVYETKARFSQNGPGTLLQNAVDSSAEDPFRKAESLNAIKQRLFDRGKSSDVRKVERFQNEADYPYTEVYGATVLLDNLLFCNNLASSTDTSSHPYSDSLMLIVIKGNQMMQLVHDLYEKAANEA